MRKCTIGGNRLNKNLRHGTVTKVLYLHHNCFRLIMINYRINIRKHVFIPVEGCLYIVFKRAILLFNLYFGHQCSTPGVLKK